MPYSIHLCFLKCIKNFSNIKITTFSVWKLPNCSLFSIHIPYRGQILRPKSTLSDPEISACLRLDQIIVHSAIRIRDQDSSLVKRRNDNHLPGHGFMPIRAVKINEARYAKHAWPINLHFSSPEPKADTVSL